MSAKHSPAIIILSASKLIERFSYYGVRSILILWLQSDSISFNKTEASYIYGSFTAAMVFAPLLGGICSDILLGARRTMIIGGFVQAAGCLLLAAPDRIVVLIGLALIAIGSGLYSPSSIAAVGYAYHKRESLASSAMIIIYGAINLGAFLAPLLIGQLEENKQLGFLICGLTLCLSQLLLLLPRQALQDIPETSLLIPKRISHHNYRVEYFLPPLLALLFFVPVFWFCYEAAAIPLWETLSDQDWLMKLGTVAVLVFAVILAIVLTFVKGSPFAKISAGLLLGVLCAATSFLLSATGSSMEAAIVIIGVFQPLSELLFTAVALSFVSQTAPYQFKTLTIAGYLIVTGFLSQLVMRVNLLENNTQLLVGSVLLIVGAILFFVLWLLWRKKRIVTRETSNVFTIEQ